MYIYAYISYWPFPIGYSLWLFLIGIVVAGVQRISLTLSHGHVKSTWQFGFTRSCGHVSQEGTNSYSAKQGINSKDNIINIPYLI